MREFKDSVSGKTDDRAEITVGTTQETTAHSPARENESVH
jgi:hypothetical protein